MSDEVDILWTRIDRIACGKCGTVLDVSALAPFAVIECPSCQTKQTVPVQLGSFLLVEQLGAGGMGAVYRAMDPTLGRFVAIKVMKAEMGEDPALVESFLREARAAAALNHPNIVQIYSCGQEQGQPYIVMELVGGGRLDLLMADGKKVDEVRLLEISLDVAEGLKAANEAKLVHGDIKPANVLFDKSGRARIVDFGLAMFVNRQQEQGGVWGTPYYISPERARGGKADHRSDIYSLGATMFHALAGQPPFDGKTAADVVVARLKKPPPDVRDVAPDVQPATADLILRMMAADPVLRYPTSSSLLADMRHALSEAKYARSPSGRANLKKGKKKDRGPLIIFAVAGVVLLVLLGIVLSWVLGASKELATPASAAATTKPAAAEAAPATNMPGTEITVQEVGRERKSMIFFGAEREAEVVKALAPLAERPAQAAEQLNALIASAPTNSPDVLWLTALHALALRAQGGGADWAARLNEVVEAPNESAADHPSRMPRAVARYILGEVPASALAGVRRVWPEWFGDLVRAFEGTGALFAGDPATAARELDYYVLSPRTEPAWAYALRPAARQWLQGVDEWARVRRTAVAQLRAQQGVAARETFDAYLRTAPAHLKPIAEQLRTTIWQTEQNAVAERQRVEQLGRRVHIQRDLDKIDAWLAEQTALLVQQKDFRKIAEGARELAAGLETDEGKEQAAIVQEHFDRMNTLRNQLTRELNEVPFRQPDRELGGEAVGATLLGLRANIGGRLTTRPWEQVSPRLLVRLLGHLAENNWRPDEAKAEMLISLAVMSAYYGAQDAADNFAKQALDADPRSAPKLRRLLPETPAPGAGGEGGA
ncbi:MAG TPA: protein kinase [Kiritimatiellia bacterium]|nr:protein kinase [Kiritimatiellia bacterium]